MRDQAGTVLVDRAHLERQTFGDADLARDILGLFAEQCRWLLPGIADRTRPAPERADLAHTLKGSALGVGAERVARLSGALEASLRAGAGEATTDDLAAAVAETLAALADLA